MLPGEEREDEDTADGEDDACPLPGVEPLAEDEQGADERPHRPRSLPGADDRDRQVLERQVRAEPGTEDDHRFENRQQVAAEIERRHKECRLTHQRRHETGAEQGQKQDSGGDKHTRGQDINHRVITQRYLLADIIEPQTERREESKDDPGHLYKKRLMERLGVFSKGLSCTSIFDTLL